MAKCPDGLAASIRLVGLPRFAVGSAVTGACSFTAGTLPFPCVLSTVKVGCRHTPSHILPRALDRAETAARLRRATLSAYGNAQDRESTRLNSSHLGISYAV